jgi:hypothetical protein
VGEVDVWSNEISARDRALHLGGINTARIRGNQMVTSGGSYVLYQDSGALTEGTQEIFNNYIRGVSSQDVVHLRRSQNAKVYHNTIINDSAVVSSNGLNQVSPNPGLDFRNNICVANGGTAARFYGTADLFALAANIYNSTFGAPVLLDNSPISSLAAYQSAFGDMSSLYTDPLLEEDSYVLQAGSPAINAGVAIAEVPLDINGFLRELPDIGCYEYHVLTLAAPQNLSLTKTYDALTLSWDEVPGADHYIIYSANSPDATSWDQEVSQSHVLSLSPGSALRFFKVSAVSE